MFQIGEWRRLIAKLGKLCPGYDLLWLRSSDVGAAGEDFTLHRLLDVSPHSARRDIQRRVQSENLEDVMMIRMAGWRCGPHVLRTTEAGLIRSAWNRSAL